MGDRLGLLPSSSVSKGRVSVTGLLSRLPISPTKAQSVGLVSMNGWQMWTLVLSIVMETSVDPKALAIQKALADKR